MLMAILYNDRETPNIWGDFSPCLLCDLNSLNRNALVAYVAARGIKIDFYIAQHNSVFRCNTARSSATALSSAIAMPFGLPF